MSKISEAQKAQKEYLEALKPVESLQPQPISISLGDYGTIEYTPTTDTIYIIKNNGKHPYKFSSSEAYTLLGALYDLFNDNELIHVLCPCCGKELEWVDFFGKNKDSEIMGIDKCGNGNVYKCVNETCTAYGNYYWAYSYNGTLHEGYPL